MMTVRRQVFFLLCCAVFVSFSAACGMHRGAGDEALVPVTVESSKKFSPRSINEIVVLPFDTGFAGGASGSSGHNISDSALSDSQASLVHSVQLNTTLVVRNATDPEAVRKTTAKYIPRRGTAREQAVYVGRDLGVQGVLYGTLSTFTELQGSSIGSETPAAVSCTIWLIDTQSGEVLWSARFADNERPLSENIFRLKRRLSSSVGNSTASQLLEAGFTEALRRLEAERTATASN